MSPSLRKAAILVSSLDTRSADALLDQMGEAKAAQVRSAIMELGDIDPGEQQRIITEFLGGPGKKTDDGGVELELSTASASAARPSADSPAETMAEPFAFLHQTDGESIAACLKQERPQLAAVVVSHLPPDLAAQVVEHLPPTLQGDVLRRIARLDATEPLAIKELEEHLRASLAPYLNRGAEAGRGRSAVEAILRASSASHRSGLLTQLAQSDPRLGREMLAGFERPPLQDDRAARTPSALVPQDKAAALNRGPSIQRSSATLPTRLPANDAADELVFDDLAQMDERSWSVLLRISDPQVALFALVGAAPALVDRALARLSPTQAKAARKKLEQPGPVKLRDLDAAREELLELAHELEAEGRLRLPSPRPLAAA